MPSFSGAPPSNEKHHAYLENYLHSEVRLQQRIKFTVLAVLGVYCTLVLIASVYLQIYWLFFLLIVCSNALCLLVTGRFFVRLFIFPFSVFVARNMVEVLQNEKLCKELYTLNNYV